MEEAGDDRLKEFRIKLSEILHRICPAALSGEVEDLVQAATIRVWARIESEGNVSLNSSYLWKVAHSVVIDEVRRARWKRETELGEADAVLEGSRTQNPEITVSGLEAGRAIRECLGKLVPPRRRAVTAYLLGHSVPETSRLLGWNPKKAENLVYRGLEQMRRCLRLKGVTP